MGLNLKKALDYARLHTVWGRDNIPKGIAEDEAESALRSLPLVGSEELAACPDRFTSDEFTPLNSYWTTTGGTGRNPTAIRLSNSSYGIEWRHMHSIWCGGVCEKGDKTDAVSLYRRSKDLKLTLRGYHLKEGELLRFDPVYNELSVDPFQLTADNFGAFLRKIRKYPIRCLHGYPSLVEGLVERLKTAGETMTVKAVYLGSEGASSDFKHKVADFFGAKVISWYGLSEKVVLAYDADMTGRFVTYTSYGYPWICHPDDNGIGEIIGTTFVNAAMPLVNYMTGDYGRIVCENGHIVLDQLHGRWGKDFVWRSAAVKIPTSAVNLHGAIQRKIVFYQMVQKEYGKLFVRVLPRVGFCGDEVRQELKTELESRLKGFEITCDVVKSDTEFARSSRGKMIMLVQELK